MSVLTSRARPVAPGTTTPPQVWHVGRRGEVAGGMTQVVNAYLDWPFEHVDVRLLPTRNGGMGPAALALMLAAAVRMPFLGRRDRTVVAVHLSQGGSFIREGLLLRWASCLGYGTTAHLHGSTFVDFAQRSPALVAKTLRRADVVVALSQITIAEVTRLAPDTRVEFVQNAVPAGAPSSKERLVVFAGAVTRRKGVDVLLEAWRRRDPANGWTLHVAGPAVEPELLDDLPANVVIAGSLPHSELMSLLDRSAVAVLPSRDEAMPMFILEALARRNAVISTTVGGIPGVLGGGAGVMVSPGDVDAFAAALDAVTADPEGLEQTAAAGHARYVSEYAAATVYPRVEELWLSTLRGA
ncbi:glycosyltransferase family 4 protein [Microbacterium sp. CFBP9034]|uniref:glycosyltransferase family 4 protein n=1 Tax=Microbacterium sp. CFBP9034 TaxID=3096540 RepID=UPI002A6B41B5|nr:glycosyltransferase family 4 protein [Microbacterium sp. CFBP9034]MDY0910376.1 glycosyltransferase family 4 protein [Microbacterium sp. CFBP9034]